MKMNLITALTLLVGLSTTQFAKAQDWDLAGYGALNVSSNTTYTLKASAGDINVDAKGKLSGSYGAEAFRKVTDIFYVGALIDESYFASDVLDGIDLQLSIMIVPKIKLPVSEHVFVWAGFGVGTAFTVFGTSQNNNGNRYNFNDRSASSFVYSPRVGVDFYVLSDAFIGLQAAYMANTAGDSRADAYTSNAQGTFTTRVSHSFVSIGLRIGVSFGDSAKSKAPEEEEPLTPTP